MHDAPHPDLSDHADDLAASEVDTSVLPPLDSVPDMREGLLEHMLNVAFDPATPEPEGDLIPEASDEFFVEPLSDEELFPDDATDSDDLNGFDDFESTDFGADELSDAPTSGADADETDLFDDSSDAF
ncbi:hypothetical protein QP027_09050 [Corynebacterium breve]|uniref:DNA primase n=1 Tax=Corynebacterium breve TaxID=3049799 RepID=A0ABY8VC54_9CORY|nr:hypothetical protein [Corynebacterium breve]WIM67256.1 hypothetical protein QP027_09050 [Corynebacterium breve]